MIYPSYSNMSLSMYSDLSGAFLSQVGSFRTFHTRVYNWHTLMYYRTLLSYSLYPLVLEYNIKGQSMKVYSTQSHWMHRLKKIHLLCNRDSRRKIIKYGMPLSIGLNADFSHQSHIFHWLFWFLKATSKVVIPSLHNIRKWKLVEILNC